MKPAIYKVMVLMALLAIPAATLYAQSTGSRFTVPSSFVVNGQTLPAGEYFVEGLWWNAVAFHNLKGEPGLVVLAQYSPRTLINIVLHCPVLIWSVGGGHRNVSGRYPSRKMGTSVQFESHRVELPFIHELEA